MEHHPTNTPTLRETIRVIRRRSWIPILTTLLFGGLAFSWSSNQTPQYEASSTMSVTSADFGQLLLGSAKSEVDRSQAELVVMSSGKFLAEVDSQLGYPATFTTEAEEGTDLIHVTATAETGPQAAEAADVFTETYQSFRKDAAASRTEKAAAELNEEITKLKAAVAEAEGPQRVIQAELDQLGPLAPEADRRAVEGRLNAERARVSARVNNLDARLNANEDLLSQLQLANTVTATGGVEVLTPAEVPDSPTSPKPLRNGLVAGFVGLVVGGALLLLLDRLDDRIRDPRSLELMTGLPVLAVVPVGPQPKGDEAWLISDAEAASPGAESYRTLRTALQFLNLGGGPLVVEVTSALPQEGKSTVSANLGVVFAAAGHRTLIIGLDLRRPRLHHLFSLEPRHGFSTLIVGMSSPEEAIQGIPGYPSLDVLPAGPLTPNPSELLQFRRTQEAITNLRSRYDVIIIDTPPVLPVADASIVARMVDATVFVARAGKSRRRSLVEALSRLRKVDAPVAGTVLVGVNKNVMYDAYAYDYGPTESFRLSGEASRVDRTDEASASAGNPRS